MLDDPFSRLEIGQIVHYVAAADSNEPGIHWPAIVTRVSDSERGIVSLTVFTDRLATGSVTRTLVPYDADGAPETWHFAADDAFQRVGADRLVQ